MKADLYVASHYVDHEDGKAEKTIDRIQDIRKNGSVSGGGKMKGQEEAVYCKIIKRHKGTTIYDICTKKGKGELVDKGGHSRMFASFYSPSQNIIKNRILVLKCN